MDWFYPAGGRQSGMERSGMERGWGGGAPN